MNRFPGFADAQYSGWKALLSALNYRTEKCFTFPYLVENDPSLPSVIQGLLDSTLKCNAFGELQVVVNDRAP